MKIAGIGIGIATIIVAVFAAYIAFTQLMQQMNSSEETSRLIFRQLEIQEAVATLQARNIEAGPQATALAQEVAMLLATKDALQRQMGDGVVDSGQAPGEDANTGSVAVLPEPTVEPPMNTPLPTNTPTPKPPPTATYTPTPDTRLFWDDFNNGMKSEWVEDSGEWRMVDGKLQTLDDKAKILIGDDSWHNYIVELDAGPARPHGNTYTYNGVYISVRSQNDGSAMRFGVWGKTARCYIVEGQERTELKEVEVNYQDPYRLRVEANDDKFSFYVGGTEICFFEDNTYPTGKVGMDVTIGRMGPPLIDNFEVRALE